MTAENSHAAAPINSASQTNQQTFKLSTVGNQPITRVEFQTPWARSRHVGAIIINRHSLNGTFDILSAGAIRILVSMTMIHGVARDNCAGLVIKRARFEEEKALRSRLSKAVGLADRSNYQPILELIEHQIIRRTQHGGPIGDEFEVIMPAEPLGGSPEMDDDPSLDCDASQSSDGSGGEQPLQDKNLARADSDASQSSDGQRAQIVMHHNPVTGSEFVKSDLPAQIGDASQSARAGRLSLNNNLNVNNITGGEEDQNADKMGLVSELHLIGLPPKRVEEFSQTITLRQAVAVRIHLSQIKQSGFNKVGLAIKKFKDPENEIAEKDLHAADRELNPSSPTPAAPTRSSVESNNERSFERKVDDAIASLSNEQLAEIQDQAVQLARTDAAKKSIRESDPRTQPMVRMIVRGMLQKSPAEMVAS